MSPTEKAIIMRSECRAACSHTESIMSKVDLAKWPLVVSGSTQIEKNSAPRLPAPRFVQADVAGVFWIGVADIKVCVQKTLRRVRMGIHDNRGVVDGSGPG